MLSLTASVGVIALGVLQGIVVAIAAVGADVLPPQLVAARCVVGPRRRHRRVAQLEDVPDATEVADVVVYRWEAPLFFANAGAFRDQVHRLVHERHPAWFVLVCEAITDIDVTAAGMLDQLDHELNAAGVHIAFVEMRTRLQDLVETYGLFADAGRRPLLPERRGGARGHRRRESDECQRSTEKVSARRRAAALVSLALLRAARPDASSASCSGTRHVPRRSRSSGSGVAAAGGWWVVTEPMPRRAFGIVGRRASASSRSSWRSPARSTVRIEICAAGRRRHRPARRHARRRHTRQWNATRAASTSTRALAAKGRRATPYSLCNPWSGGGKVKRFGLRRARGRARCRDGPARPRAGSRTARTRRRCPRCGLPRHGRR